MFKPLSFSIGLRYTRAKKRNHFISFISGVSMFGIALGVMVLMTVMSVMNGFDREIKDRILTMIPEVTVSNWSGSLSDWAKAANFFEKRSGVQGVSPFVMGEGMISMDDVPAFAVLEGVDISRVNQVLPIESKMIKGRLSDLGKAPFGIVLGEELASNLGVSVGDKVIVTVPGSHLTPLGVMPTLRQFTVRGVFSVGYQYDENYALIGLQEAQKLFGLGAGVSGLQIKLNDAFSADRWIHSVKSAFSLSYRMQSWIEQNPNFFKALKMEKTIMFLMLLLIIAVAAFNMLSSLVMLVTDKQSDVAILRTMGASRGFIIRIFMIQGVLIGFFGTLIGTVFGILLSLHVTQITNWFQGITGAQILNSSVYYIDFVPSRLMLSDVLVIIGISLSLSVLSTIYPAWRASQIEPAEALRYE